MKWSHYNIDRFALVFLWNYHVILVLNCSNNPVKTFTLFSRMLRRIFALTHFNIFIFGSDKDSKHPSKDKKKKKKKSKEVMFWLFAPYQHTTCRVMALKCNSFFFSFFSSQRKRARRNTNTRRRRKKTLSPRTIRRKRRRNCGTRRRKWTSWRTFWEGEGERR